LYYGFRLAVALSNVRWISGLYRLQRDGLVYGGIVNPINGAAVPNYQDLLLLACEAANFSK
jgi:hypothetical protein